MIIATIDFCALSDVEVLHVLEAECFSDPWHPSIFREELRAGMGLSIYIKALLRESVAGYAVFDCEGRNLHLTRLGVAKAHRRFGVATQLLAAVEEIALYKKCSRIKLEVRESNGVASLFYESMGLRLLSRARRFYSDGESALVYVGNFPLKFSVAKGTNNAQGDAQER